MVFSELHWVPSAIAAFLTVLLAFVKDKKKHRYGYKWTKWITKIEVVNMEVEGYWESRGYSTTANVGEFPFE